MGLTIARTTPVLARAAWSICGAAVVVGAASAANFASTLPKALSLLIEPFSLFLLPGLLASLAIAGPHDYSLNIVLFASLSFYAAVFYFTLTRLSRRRALR